MKNILICICSMVFLVSCGITPSDSTTSTPQQETENTSLVSWSWDMTAWEIKEKISDSPRHQEWVEIDNNGKTIYAFVVYPENKEKSSAVIMIHENKWLTDWVRDMADQVAAEWHIVIAPDLLSDFSEDKKRTSDFETPDDATQALYTLDPQQVRSDLDAVTLYAQTLDSYNGNIVSAGFCWGGSQAFSFANNNSDLQASLVFYGTWPEDEQVYEGINIPVYAFYAENDERVNSTIEETERFMTEKGNVFEYEIYDDVGHAFMRNAQGEDGDDISKNSRDQAFDRMKEILSQYQ